MGDMPRRLQLSSMVISLLFQDKDFLIQIITAFLNIPTVKELFNGYENKISTDNIVNTMFDSNICILDNSGYGGTQQPIGIISNIFLSAIDLCVLEKGMFNEDIIETNLHKAIDDFKMFAKNEKVEETHLIGFSGFNTEQDIRIGFGNLNAFPLNTFQTSYFFGNNKKIGFVIKETFQRKKVFSGTSEKMQQFYYNNPKIANEEFLKICMH